MPGLNANTKLLLNFDGVNASTIATDQSAGTHSTTFIGTAQLSTSLKKFGTAALSLDGNGDQVNIAASPDFDLFASTTGTTSFDLWVYAGSSSSEEYILYYLGTGYWYFRREATTGVLRGKQNTLDWDITTTTTLSTLAWSHVLLLKVDQAVYVCVNGFTIATDTLSAGASPVSPTLYVGGSNLGGSSGWTGSFDELRFQEENYFNVCALPATYAHFKCNDNAGTNVVTDDGSGSNDGVSSVASTSTISVSGKINTAFDLGGSAVIQVDDLVADIAADATGSFAVWIKTSITGSSQTIIGAAVGTSNRDLIFYVDGSGYLGIITRDGSGDGVNSKATTVLIGDDTWTHVAVVQNGTSPALYVNGEAVSVTDSGTDSTNWFADVAPDNMDIGQRTNGSDVYQGEIDDLRYYQSVLTETMVKNIYNSGLGHEEDESYFTPPTEAYAEIPAGFSYSQGVIIA